MFIDCILTILKSANLQLEDEEAIRRAFNDQFGSEGDRFGLEVQGDETPGERGQLENVAKLLDCRVTVISAEETGNVRWSGPTEVINPAGTQQCWAKWTSSVHDAIKPLLN